jgi:LacI family transcriptional regulator
MKRDRATILDVAHLAGVSRQTVSRVMNGSPLVSKAAELRVRKAIQELKYRPDSLARGLVTRRSFVLGVLTRDLRYTHAQILEGAEASAREKGYQLFISGSEHSDHGEPIHSPLLSRQRVEGLLIVYQGSDHDTHEIFRELGEDIPVVSIGYAAGKKRVTEISIENRKAAYLATRHLLGLGHRRIAHITGPAHYHDSKERRLGYSQALQEASVEVDPSIVVEGMWSVESGYQAALQLLERGREFTAIFSQDDWMAIGCIRALHERGLQVPRDVAVVGFDNIPPAQYIEPPLTTVKYPGRQVGMLCARALIARIEGNARSARAQIAKGRTDIDAVLIVRSSCGAGSAAYM